MMAKAAVNECNAEFINVETSTIMSMQKYHFRKHWKGKKHVK
ncbi:MAG TPA: hypothetical protein VMV47_11005 [Bacteroidales bacterium]|nr:hypothetical protein [Bacteroidales bacterium]